jgi:hypothetical protein
VAVNSVVIGVLNLKEKAMSEMEKVTQVRSSSLVILVQRLGW